MASRTRFLYYGIIIGALLLGAGGGFYWGSAALHQKQTGVVDLTDRVEELASQIEENREQISDLETSLKKNTSLIADNLRQLQNENRTVRQQVEQIHAAAALEWKRNFSNGHSYCVTPYAMPWHAARRLAGSLGGYLVAINDASENEWLVENFDSAVEYWVGCTDEELEGQWVWADGHPMEYFNWLEGEPDNYRSSQHYVIINARAPHKGLTEAGKWNDVIANESRPAIIEREK